MIRLFLPLIFVIFLGACGGSGGSSGSDTHPELDSDNDGTPDISDDLPLDPTETVDSDLDGVGDNSDAYPNDPDKTTFSVTGSINGLSSEVKIYLNDQSLSVREDGDFEFSVFMNTSFTIQANNIAGTQLCNVTNATHTAVGNIGAVLIECVDREPLLDVLTSTYFTDGDFLSCLNNLDEIESKLYVDQLTSVTCKNAAITSIEGIERLSALTELVLDLCRITQIDVSHNLELTLLSAPSNIVLNNVNIGENSKLITVILNDNAITDLIVGSNTNLETLKVFNNPLTQLDISNNAKLSELNLENTELSTIDLRFNTELTKLTLNNTAVGAEQLPNLEPVLDLSQNVKLIRLFLNNSQLSKLDVSHNPNLTRMDAENNQLIASPTGLSEILSVDVFIKLSGNSFDNAALVELQLLQETYSNLSY